jgi:NitT/TauT family transport system permease protein
MGRLRAILTTASLGVVLLAAWEGAVDALRLPSYILPAPSAVALALWHGVQRGIYPPHVMATLSAMLSGYAIGTVLGILLGAAIAEAKVLERLLLPYVVGLQSVPKIALAPLFVMWFGYGLSSKVVMVSLMCFFPLMVNTMTGLLSADRDRIDMLRAMTATPWQVFRFVKLPSAAGHIFAGLQVSVALALIATLVAEFVGSDYGLGNLIEASQAALDTAGMFAVLVILAAIGLVTTALVRWAHRRVVFWEREERRTLPEADG